MTDPISRLSRTLSALRLGTKARSSETASKAGNKNAPTKADATATQVQQQHAGAEQLRADIARRIRAIDPRDPNRSGAAVRIFIERVLLHELGSQLERSPQFHTIVADVQREMEADDQIREELLGLIAEFERK